MEVQVVGTVLFYLFSLTTIIAAIAVVRTQRILRGAIYLAGTLVASAALYLLLGFEFLAGIQILVYVGGIVVVIVFAIVLTSSVDHMETHPSKYRQLLGLFTSALFFVSTSFAFATTAFSVKPEGSTSINNVSELGRKFLDYGPEGYVLPFEIISLLLLASMIGAIVVVCKFLYKVDIFDDGVKQ